MLLGKSSFHVNQGEGKYFSTNELNGYYNDLTNKVLSKTALLDENKIPYNINSKDEIIYFPGTIFQYGLGLYDLYLETKDKDYYNNFLKIAEWTLENMKINGMWDCMKILKDPIHKSQSSMCQSQGISVLLRAYNENKDTKFLEAAKIAIEFMITDKKDGGTCYYSENEVIFQEYVAEENQSVLNGWIFSIFGLYDYVLLTKDVKIKKVMNASVDTLIKKLKEYDRGYWSNYDLVGTIASPAYHDLHIRQLRVLYKMFNKNEFLEFSNKLEKYQKKFLYKYIAMFRKLLQKLRKSKYYDISTSLVK